MSDFGLDTCLDCGTCTENCPSARHGGIVPNLIIKNISEGKPPEHIWKCLQCYRCSMVCPVNIDVCGLICHLKNLAATNNDIPECFKRLSIQMFKDLKMNPIDKRAIRQRTDLGLSVSEISEEDKKIISSILREAGFDKLFIV
ncbi:MAG: 4Fe-4S dicluster domain-containing protein [archaeon]|nr:4Fe-4S dicluster domain-containing protein [archaeon]